VRKISSSNTVCESMILCSCVKVRQGTLFVTTVQDCEVHNSAEKGKIMPFSNASPLFICLGDKEEGKCGSHGGTALLGYESRVGFGCCEGNSLLPKG